MERIERFDDGFRVSGGTSSWRAPRLLFATGARDHVSDLPEIEHNLQRRALAYCPVCDGFEASGKMIGVIGIGDHALREATFLKAFSPWVTILPDSQEHLSDEFRADARAAGVGSATR